MKQDQEFTVDGFEYGETVWEHRPEAKVWMKLGIAYFQGQEVARVPAIVTEREFNEADPTIFTQIDLNLRESANDLAKMKLKWPPYGPKESC